MIVYKVNMIKELKKLGLDYAAMKKYKIISQCTMRKFAKDDVYISIKSLNTLCCVLGLQPGDVFEYIETQEDRENILDIINEEREV